MKKIMKVLIGKRATIFFYLHFEVASNFSLFFFLLHFHGLKNRPNALNLLFRSSGGDLVPDPKLFVLKAAPFCFLAEKKNKKKRRIQLITMHNTSGILFLKYIF